MKQLLSSLADGQIEMYQAVRSMIFTFCQFENWLIRSRRRWRNGTASSLLSNVFELMSKVYQLHYNRVTDFFHLQRWTASPEYPLAHQK